MTHDTLEPQPESFANDAAPPSEDFALVDDLAEQVVEATQIDSEEAEDTLQSADHTELDVGAALAAVANLEILARPTVETDDSAAYDDEIEGQPDIVPFVRQDEDAASLNQPISETTAFARPPLTKIQRGQMSSVIPALLLIGVGAWLTFSLTTNSVVIRFPLFVYVVIVVAGLVLLSHWYSSGRWARGAFLSGMGLLLNGLLLLFLSFSGQSALWPFLLVGTGLSIWITPYFTQPYWGNLTLIGWLFIMGGLTGLVWAYNLLPATVASVLTSVWPVILIVVLIVMFAPFVRRRSR